MMDLLAGKDSDPKRRNMVVIFMLTRDLTLIDEDIWSMDWQSKMDLEDLASSSPPPPFFSPCSLFAGNMVSLIRICFSWISNH